VAARERISLAVHEALQIGAIASDDTGVARSYRPGSDEGSDTMSNKAVISLSTGLEDAEKVTVAFLVAVGAAETGRETLMFLSKEAVRLSLTGAAAGAACDGCPPLADLVKRYEAAGGRYYVCPICFEAKHLDAGRPDRRRGAERHHPAVEVDRRRAGDDVQLLTG